MTSLPPRLDECVSDLKLDQLRVRELSEASSTQVRAHLTSCAECQQRYTVLCEDAERFATDAPAFASLRAQQAMRDEPLRSETSGQKRGSSRATWVRRGATWSAVAAAAGLVLFVSRNQPERGAGTGAGTMDEMDGAFQRETEPGVRTKGASTSFDFIVRRGEHTVVGIPSMTLHPGDRLRFTVSATEVVYCGLWGIDADLQVIDYATASRLIRVPAGEQVALPQTIELDESVGTERIVAVFCDSPHDADAIRTALSVSAEAPRLPLGCAAEAVHIRKALR